MGFLPLGTLSLDFVEALSDRLAAMLDVPVERFEEAFIERYLPGQFTFERHAGPGRAFTALVYLNEVPAGCEDGMTDFKYSSFQFRPDLTGAALIWGSSSS